MNDCPYSLHTQGEYLVFRMDFYHWDLKLVFSQLFIAYINHCYLFDFQLLCVMYCRYQLWLQRKSRLVMRAVCPKLSGLPKTVRAHQVITANRSGSSWSFLFLSDDSDVIYQKVTHWKCMFKRPWDLSSFCQMPICFFFDLNAFKCFYSW